MSRHRARLRLETVDPRAAMGMLMKALSVLTASNARATLIHSFNGPKTLIPILPMALGNNFLKSTVKFVLLSDIKYLDFISRSPQLNFDLLL